jgi:hypothetical protein
MVQPPPGCPQHYDGAGLPGQRREDRKLGVRLNLGLVPEAVERYTLRFELLQQSRVAAVHVAYHQVGDEAQAGGQRGSTVCRDYDVRRGQVAQAAG